MNNEVSAKGLEATLKSADTEEWIDLLFYRPIGYRWALLFRHLGVTPNAITIASIFLGIAAGILFYYIDLSFQKESRSMSISSSYPVSMLMPPCISLVRKLPRRVVRCPRR